MAEARVRSKLFVDEGPVLFLYDASGTIIATADDLVPAATTARGSTVTAPVRMT